MAVSTRKAEFVTFELGFQLPGFLSGFPGALAVVSPRDGCSVTRQLIRT